MDIDRSGKISVQELQRALAMGNLCFSLSTVAHMIRVHDTSGRGEIDFEEFRTFFSNIVDQIGE